MKFSTASLILVTSGAMVAASAIPAQLEQRALGTREDPTWIDIDCSGGAAYSHVCNVDCYAILCFAAPNPVQYDAKNSDKKRKLSGYSSSLLKVLEATRFKKGIKIAEWVLEKLGYSPEETVFANAVQGGAGEIMAPVDAKANTDLGARVGGRLRKDNAVPDGDWYFKWFTNYGNARYCSALQGGLSGPHSQIPKGGVRPDTSVCPEKDKPEDDPANIMFMRELTDGEDGAMFHMMKYSAGDRWSGKPWGAQGSFPKRDVEGDYEKATELKARK